MNDVPEAATIRAESIKVDVIIEVSHQVTVSLDTYSNLSFNDLQELAMKAYHAVEKSEWRNQFGNKNRDVIRVSDEHLRLVQVISKPRQPWTA